MTIRNKILLTVAVILTSLLTGNGLQAQEKTDTLIINVGKSRILFIVNDKKDLETLKSYDLNEILRQLSLKLDNDSTGQTLVHEENGETNQISDTTIVVKKRDVIVKRSEESDYDRDGDEDDDRWRKRRSRGLRHFFNFDLGTNNYVQDGSFPDETDEPYTVRPWGSWYVGLSSTNHLQVAGPFYLEFGPSVTWYNFKFQNDRMTLIDGSDGIVFEEATIPDADFEKSKLTIAYVNFSVVPMFGFGNSRRDSRKDFWQWKDWNDDDRGFRIGLGGYGGYRIASYTKIVYENGDKEKDKNKDNFHLNNFRYGVRLQMGYRGTDLFFNYDMNELFAEGKGPALNAFSFGLTF